MVLEVMYKLFEVQLPIKVLVTCLHNFLENQSKDLRCCSPASYHNREITVLQNDPRCPLSKDVKAVGIIGHHVNLLIHQSYYPGSQRLSRSQARAHSALVKRYSSEKAFREASRAARCLLSPTFRRPACYTASASGLALLQKSGGRLQPTLLAESWGEPWNPESLRNPATCSIQCGISPVTIWWRG